MTWWHVLSWNSRLGRWWVFLPSPYICVPGQTWIEEVILGDPNHKANLFKLARVIMNVPCTGE